MRKSKADKAIDKRVERAYYARCQGVQIGVMDISKVFTVGRAAVAEGADDATLGDRIAAFVATIAKG